LKPELHQYQGEPGNFWLALPMLGGDGYDAIDLAKRQDWHAIPYWGKDGYTLGSWPLIIIFFRDREGWFDVIEYVEGDATMWACPAEAIREEVTNELAFFHWKHRNEEWVKGYDSVDQLPDDVRGPYRPWEKQSCYHKPDWRLRH